MSKIYVNYIFELNQNYKKWTLLKTLNYICVQNLNELKLNLDAFLIDLSLNSQVELWRFATVNLNWALSFELNQNSKKWTLLKTLNYICV